MSFTVTDAFVQQFSGTVRFLAQQQESRFRGKVLEDTINGEGGYMEQLAPTAARKAQSRHEDSPLMNSQHLRRRIVPYDYDWGDLIDKLDRVRLLIDPTSAYAQNAAMAMKRGQDDEVIGAFFSAAHTGHSGTAVVNWPNGNAESSPIAPAGTVVAVNSWAFGTGAGNTGLTISKLIEAKMALTAAEGDEEEEFFLALGTTQLGNLLSTTEVTNADYTTVQALVEGKISRFMGFSFVRTQRLLLNGSSQTRCPAWRKSGMGLGIAQDIEGQISPRPDKKFSTYVYADEAIGASRLEEAKVCEIICA